MPKQLQAVPKYGLRPAECAQAVGSPALWSEIVAAGWVKPVVDRHKLKIYSASDVAVAFSRIVAGELPKN